MLYKRFVIGLLAAALLLLAACADGGDDGAAVGDDIGGGGAEAAEVAGDDAPVSRWGEEIMPDLPESDFGGYEFNVLVRFIDDIHWAPWAARDIYAEELTGEPINDAVHRRNAQVEEMLNVRIVETQRTDHANVLRNSISANDDEFDIYYAGFNDITNVAPLGFFYNLFDVPYIDLDAPWWCQNAASSLSIANMLFLCTSDLILLHNDSTSALVFNKQMISDFGMDNPHELVANNQWTFAQLTEMSSHVSYDVNADGIMDYNDMFGYVHYRDSALSLMHAAGGRIAMKDADDLPVLTLNSERAISALLRAFDLMYAPSAFNVHRELEGRFDAIYLVSHRMFMEDRALFYWILLHDIVSFRDMDSDFGILPIPKYDAHQLEFGHTVNQYHGFALAIPTSVQDIERTAIILETLTARSRFTLLPAYYDISLQRKFTRDEESADMLDIIFATQVYDIGAIYNIGGFSWEIIFMTMSHNRDIVSLIERRENAANRDIERMIDRHLEMLN